MNKIILTGTVVKRSPKTENGKITVTIVPLGENADDEHVANYVSVVALKKGADFVEKFIEKGKRIGIEGRVVASSYQDKEGKTIYKQEIIADNFEFLTKKEKAESLEDKVMEK